MPKLELQINGITTSHHAFKLSDVTFSLQAGDIMGLIGSSGSGKSTLIETILGLKKQDIGSITVVDAEGNKLPLTEVIGYSPQKNALYPLLTIEENLKTFGRLHRMNYKEIKKLTNLLLPRLGLENHKKKKIIQLSGGMQKRADLAVSLIHSPQVIVLDEPFSGLDLSLCKFIWDLLVQLSKGGRILIISSHRVAELQKYCNKFGLIHNGSYYNTEQIMKSLGRRRRKSIPDFIEALFSGKTTMGAPPEVTPKDQPIIDLEKLIPKP